jgi:hypothetical protein
MLKLLRRSYYLDVAFEGIIIAFVSVDKDSLEIFVKKVDLASTNKCVRTHHWL